MGEGAGGSFCEGGEGLCVEKVSKMMRTCVRQGERG